MPSSQENIAVVAEQNKTFIINLAREATYDNTAVFAGYQSIEVRRKRNMFGDDDRLVLRFTGIDFVGISEIKVERFCYLMFTRCSNIPSRIISEDAKLIFENCPHLSFSPDWSGSDISFDGCLSEREISISRLSCHLTLKTIEAESITVLDANGHNLNFHSCQNLRYIVATNVKGFTTRQMYNRRPVNVRLENVQGNISVQNSLFSIFQINGVARPISLSFLEITFSGESKIMIESPNGGRRFMMDRIAGLRNIEVNCDFEDIHARRVHDILQLKINSAQMLYISECGYLQTVKAGRIFNNIQIDSCAQVKSIELESATEMSLSNVPRLVEIKGTAAISRLHIVYDTKIPAHQYKTLKVFKVGSTFFYKDHNTYECVDVTKITDIKFCYQGKQRRKLQLFLETLKTTG